jgi:predicted RNase H-like HicB family nuclease
LPDAAAFQTGLASGWEAMRPVADDQHCVDDHELCLSPLSNYNGNMGFDDYKLVIYRNQPEGWVAEIPAIAGCHAFMPTTEEAVTELDKVFQLIEEEHRASGRILPRDTTEIVHA